METLLQEEKEIEFEEEVGTLPLREKKDNSADVLIIILLEKNMNFKKFLKPYDITVCGRKMWEWVNLAASGYKVKTTNCTNESDVLNLIKPLLENHKFTAVLYSDTPLLQKTTLEEILSFAISRDLNVLKLTRGYVFNTDYIKKVNNIQVTQTEFFEEEDFITAYDLKQLALINNIMQNRILEYHMKSGVYIENTQNVSIEADVIIEAGVRIMCNNTVRGKTIIEKNVFLDSGNIIENSIISEGCIIKQSYISESRISEFMTVGPFENIVKIST